MLPRRFAFVPIVALVGALPMARQARAEDKPAAPAATDAVSQIKQLLLDLDAAHKEKDDGKLSTLVKKAPPLYKSTQDAASKTALMKGLGALLKSSKLPSARQAALNAIVETEDGKEAWKAIQSGYPSDDDVEDLDLWNVEFIKAVGSLHPDAAIDRLLETFRKAKKADVAAKAVEALGNYGKSKQRERIFEELAKTGKNMVPSKSATANASPETVARWAAISPALGKTFDTLTGDSIGDPVEWFKKYQDNKKNLKALFKQ